LLNGI